MPMSARTVIARSENRPAVTADITPTRTPNTSQMIAAPIASEKVAGAPRLISSSTSCCVVYEIRSPLKTFFIISAYWT
jgi:hypothetical protein